MATLGYLAVISVDDPTKTGGPKLKRKRRNSML